jgi:hypothetical protein
MDNGYMEARVLGVCCPSEGQTCVVKVFGDQSIVKTEGSVRSRLPVIVSSSYSSLPIFTLRL